jgi:hypothetical protein
MTTKKTTRAAAFRRLAALYERMHKDYDEVRGRIGLECRECPANCCTSFFQHHTYVEWAYLWNGLNLLPANELAAIEASARDYLESTRLAQAAGAKPQAMCPLNREGLCALYDHRLMICRLFGVPNRLLHPDGRQLLFPGCWRCGELLQEAGVEVTGPPVLERTPLYSELVAIEMAFLGPNRIRRLPKVNLTLAEMIVQGPPRLIPGS